MKEEKEEGREEGKRQGEGRRGRERDQEERGGRLSISEPVISITKIKIHGSHGH